MLQNKSILASACALLLALGLAAAPALASSAQPAIQQAAPIRVMGLIGPTGMSLAPLIAKASPDYQITLAASPEEIVAAVVSGSVDIAAVPTNLAAVLHQKTKGEVQMLAINTLGVLSILEKGDSVHAMADLAGKTIVLSGQGAVPEYVLAYLLQANGVANAQMVFKSEHNEVSTLAASGKADLVMLPQPMATALLMKDPDFRVAVDISQAFAQAAAQQGYAGAQLAMGCLVIRKDFARRNAWPVKLFMEEYAKAVDFVNQQPDAVAEQIAAAKILPNAAIAKKAIPLSNIVYIDKGKMKDAAGPLLEILFKANPASVGGKLPTNDLYYIPPTLKECSAPQ